MRLLDGLRTWTSHDKISILDAAPDEPARSDDLVHRLQAHVKSNRLAPYSAGILLNWTTIPREERLLVTTLRVLRFRNACLECAQHGG
jgi:hypothetical protein